jgi:hypothetical protein
LVFLAWYARGLRRFTRDQLIAICGKRDKEVAGDDSSKPSNTARVWRSITTHLNSSYHAMKK